MIDCVLRNDDHVLHELLSKRVHIADTLRTRCHDRTIPENKGHLAEKNFITSMLYKIYFNFNLLQILTDVPLRFDNCFFTRRNGMEQYFMPSLVSTGRRHNVSYGSVRYQTCE